MATIAPEPSSLLEAVESYVTRYRLRDTQFGELVNREPGLLKTLRKGRQCGEKIREKIIAFIAKPPPFRCRGITSRQATAYRRVRAANIRNEAAARQHRATDPVERAKRFLQTKGYTVFMASVVDPYRDGWVVGARPDPLNDNQLLDLAQRQGWGG